MKKLLFLILALFLTALTYSQPRTIINFNAGYIFPIGDSKGTFGDSLNNFTANGNPDSATYFLKSGINFGILVQHAPSKISNLKVILGFQYIYMFQNKDYNENNNPLNVSLNLRMIQLSLGAGYMFANKRSIIKPFIETSLSVNFFGGSYTETPAIGDVQSYTLNPTVRLGILTGAGVDIKLGKRLGAQFGAKYHLANLVGKKSSGDIGKSYSLNDGDATVNGVTYKKRTITFLQVYGGISLYLGL